MRLKDFCVVGTLIISLFSGCRSNLSSNGDIVRTWLMTELKFESSNDYTSGGSEDVTLDVTFTHPRTGERVFLEAPLPEDMAALIEKWRNYTATIKY